MAKYVIPRENIAYWHGCHAYHGNSCHGYKEKIQFILQQQVLMIHPNHHI